MPDSFDRLKNALADRYAIERAGKPVCTTIIGDLFADDKMLSVAHAYQAATDWHTRHPSL